MIEMPFGLRTLVGSGNHVLDGVLRVTYKIISGPEIVTSTYTVAHRGQCA